MIENYPPYIQALFGTLFTWGLTALGAAAVFVVPRDLPDAKQQKLLDASLGFAAGVMVAASYWSLLAPAIDVATESGFYGDYAFLPVAIGFLLGGGFVLGADLLLPHEEEGGASLAAAVEVVAPGAEADEAEEGQEAEVAAMTVVQLKEALAAVGLPVSGRKAELVDRLASHLGSDTTTSSSGGSSSADEAEAAKRKAFEKRQTWRRILLLVLAITIHNFPEGMAVGVGFGAVGTSGKNTFESAKKLTIGIGLQNFPEGLSVSLPLLKLGYSPLKSFWYGQLSGMVEPFGGFLGAVSVTVARGCLPYALAFAAGAMIYVVVDDLVPEGHTHGNGRLCSLGAMVGFVVMMSMDVGLGE
mmetsp:Transcript_49127/g.96315  ORF Transcript_49127/g.96315 Transcript_49127/m.96315 type:complete len:357 (+) Transcript_49127:3-1073(+)